MIKRISTYLSLALAVVFFYGCQSYQDPEIDYQSLAYSQRKKGEADLMLNDIAELSLADAQSIALANNPSYTSAYFAIEAARMRYYQAWGAYSPTVTAGFDMQNSHNWNYHIRRTAQSDRSRNFSTSTGFQATWLAFDGFYREFALKIAELGFENQVFLTEDDCRILLRAVAFAYNDVLLAKENMRIADEDMVFQEKNLADTIIKLEAGAVAKSSKLNFQILSNVAAGNKIIAEAQYENALYALAVLMGYPEGTLPSRITFPPIKSEFVDDLPGVDIYLDNALRYRPDLLAFREQLEISRYELYQTYSAFSPTVTATIGYNFNTTRSRSYTKRQQSSNSGYNNSNLYYGLSANWTIFNGFIRYNAVREYQARYSSAKYLVADQWLTVVQEVRSAHTNYLQSVKQARLYEKTLEYTTEQRKLVEEEYRLGGAELTRLNEAQRDLIDAQTTLAGAYINVQNALSQLEASAAMNVARYRTAPKVFAPTSDFHPAVPDVPGSPEAINAASPTTPADIANEEKRTAVAADDGTAPAAVEAAKPAGEPAASIAVPEAVAPAPPAPVPAPAMPSAADIVAPGAGSGILSPEEQQLLKAAQDAADNARKQ